MGVLKNPKHEAFCQARALGRTQTEAYIDAGFKPNRQHAHRLATTGYIEDRIKELQNKTVEIFEITAAQIAKQLDEDRAFAKKCKQTGPMVQASIAKGRLAGLFIERTNVQVTHNYSQMTEEELRFELAALNAEARSLKPGVQH